jgi:hypothetical protein
MLAGLGSVHHFPRQPFSQGISILEDILPQSLSGPNTPVDTKILVGGTLRVESTPMCGIWCQPYKRYQPTWRKT